MRVGSGPYTIPISIAGATRAVDADAVDHLQPRADARPQRAGRHVHAAGRRRRRRSAARSTTRAAASTSSSRGPATRPAHRRRACWRRCSSSRSPPAPARSRVSGSATIPGGAPAALQFLPAGITVAGMRMAQGDATRLYLRRAAGRHDDRADPRVGGAAAGEGDDAADARSGAAPRAARNADRDRQVQGCRRCRHDSDHRAQGEQRRLSAGSARRWSTACRWPTTRPGGS